MNFVVMKPTITQPFLGAPDGTRTHNSQILSLLPLPIGLLGLIYTTNCTSWLQPLSINVVVEQCYDTHMPQRLDSVNPAKVG